MTLTHRDPVGTINAANAAYCAAGTLSTFNTYMTSPAKTQGERIRKSFSHQGMQLALAVLRGRRPDVVHIHDHVALTAAAVYDSELNVPLVWDAHEIYQDLAGTDPDRGETNAAIIGDNAHLLAGFVTINQSIGDFYAEHYKDLPKASIIPNASMYSERPEYDGRLHDAAGLGRDRRILLFQGGISKHRGVEALVEAAPLLSEGWAIVFMGWGPLKEDMQHAALCQPLDENGDERVAFINGAPQAELPLWTAGAALGAIPYENTSLNHLYCTPNKLWEYPLAGVPILATDLQEMGNTLREHGIGVLIPRDFDANDIASRVNALSNDELDRMRQACASYGEVNNWQAVESRLVDLYVKIGKAAEKRSSGFEPTTTEPQSGSSLQDVDDATQRVMNAVTKTQTPNAPPGGTKTMMEREKSSTDSAQDPGLARKVYRRGRRLIGALGIGNGDLKLRLERSIAQRDRAAAQRDLFENRAKELKSKLNAIRTDRGSGSEAVQERNEQLKAQVQELRKHASPSADIKKLNTTLKAVQERNEQLKAQVQESRKRADSDADVDRIRQTMKALQERNEQLKELAKKLREDYRNARVDHRSVDPTEHNTADSMNAFFAANQEEMPYGEFGRAFIKVLNEHKVELDGKRLLDLGVGPGTMLAGLLVGKKPSLIQGIDFSTVAIEQARSRFSNGTFEVASLYDDISLTGDVVLCTEVLEHLEDPSTALQTVLNAVAPDGLAILTTPDGRVDFSKYHVNFWSPESWKAFIERYAGDSVCTFGQFKLRESSMYANNFAIVRKAGG
ncbi:methyltransferase domain-containing protein [Rhizobiaceae bacterium]|nr:methyltransferase domain-containing protein [Rhizobiaceae bacterium]